MFNIILVFIGIILFFYSLSIHARFLRLVRNTPLGKWWVMLLVLVAFFTVGYFIFAYWLMTGAKVTEIGFLKSLISLVFFFGAIFVVITITLIYSTVQDL